MLVIDGDDALTSNTGRFGWSGREPLSRVFLPWYKTNGNLSMDRKNPCMLRLKQCLTSNIPPVFSFWSYREGKGRENTR